MAHSNDAECIPLVSRTPECVTCLQRVYIPLMKIKTCEMQLQIKHFQVHSYCTHHQYTTTTLQLSVRLSVITYLVLFQHRTNLEVNVKVNFTLEQATKAQRGSRHIALLFP